MTDPVRHLFLAWGRAWVKKSSASLEPGTRAYSDLRLREGWPSPLHQYASEFLNCHRGMTNVLVQRPPNASIQEIEAFAAQPISAALKPSPSASAAAATAIAAVAAVVDRRALLVTNAAADRPAGAEVDGGDQWLDLAGLGQEERVAGRRDAPVEDGQTARKSGVRESISQREARGQGGAWVHAHGARALGLGGRGNGEPLTSGCGPKKRSRSPSSCCRCLRGGAHGGTSEST